MIQLIEIVAPYAATFLGGGGLMWLFNSRLHLRQRKNDLLQDEFDTVTEVIMQATERMSALGLKLTELEAIKSDLTTKLKAQEDEIKRLQKELEKYKSINPS